MQDVNLDIKTTLDATGLICPEPVMLLHKAVREIEPGDIVKIIATDPSTTRDVPKFCHFLGHQLLQQEENGDMFVFLVRKRLA